DVVAAALESRGWKIDRRVGCAGYRIDLGVRDDDQPGRYLVGVECDGPTYHAARTARDRDRLRQSVLENLGWKLIRVWSIDWHMNPGRCLDALDKALRAARSALDQPSTPTSALPIATPTTESSNTPLEPSALPPQTSV